MTHTTVIVGHGASAEGRGWGPMIDAADLVVRMWDCEWQTAADHGRRCDVAVLTAHQKNLAAFSRTNACRPLAWWIYDLNRDWARLARGLAGWAPALADPGVGARATLHGVPVARVIDTEAWARRAVALGGRTLRDGLRLTRGTATAAAALTQEGPGDGLGRRVILVGFDTVKAGARPEREYSPACRAAVARRYRTRRAMAQPGETRSILHDYAVERPLLEEIARAAGAELRFAEDLWTHSGCDDGGAGAPPGDRSRRAATGGIAS